MRECGYLLTVRNDLNTRCTNARTYEAGEKEAMVLYLDDVCSLPAFVRR